MKEIKQKRQLVIEITDYTDYSFDVNMKGDKFTLYEIIGILEESKQSMLLELKRIVKKQNP